MDEQIVDLQKQLIFIASMAVATKQHDKLEKHYYCESSLKPLSLQERNENFSPNRVKSRLRGLEAGYFYCFQRFSFRVTVVGHLYGLYSTSIRLKPRVEQMRGFRKPLLCCLNASPPSLTDSDAKVLMLPSTKSVVLKKFL